jgi:hypothetical protein
MRNNIAFLRLVLASALCILVDLNGLAADIFLPPTDSICEGNAFITTQTEWDLFAADYAGCTTFVGDITIDNTTGQIDSISGAENFRTISGNIEITASGVQTTLLAFNGLDSIVGDLTLRISSDLFGFRGLKYLHNLVLQDLVDQSWSMGEEINGNIIHSFDSLAYCETITIRNIGIIENVFGSLSEARKIVVEDNILTAAIISNLGNNLATIDSIDIKGTYLLWNSFQNITAVDYLEIGAEILYPANIADCFNSLTNAGDIYIATNEFLPPFLNLTTVNNIWLEEYPADVGVDLALVPSLTTINGNATFILCRDTIELPSLTQCQSLSIYTNRSYLTNTGAQSVYLPNLSELSGYFELLALDESDASLQSFSAPNLSAISGSISLRGPVLTSCISPAFCESANYSPNWFEISGGPGCSTVEEIQAQCESPCPDIDLNGVCDSVQTSYIGNLTFPNTPSIENFVASFPNVTEITGDVFIGSPPLQEMIDTYPLDNIRRINGKLGTSETFSYTTRFTNLEYVKELVAAPPFDTDAFPNLLECEKMIILGLYNDVTAFENLQRCDTLILYGGESINNIFNQLTTCNFISINTMPRIEDIVCDDYFYGIYGCYPTNFSMIDAEYFCCSNNVSENVPWQSEINNSFNNIDSINIFLATNLYITNSFSNLSFIRDIYGYNLVIPDTPFQINECRNLTSVGNSDFLHLFQSVTELNRLEVLSFAAVGISGSEYWDMSNYPFINYPGLEVNFPNLRKIESHLWIQNASDFGLNSFYFPALDSIIAFCYLDGPITLNDSTAPVILNFQELDYCGSLTIYRLNDLSIQFSEQTNIETLDMGFINGNISGAENFYPQSSFYIYNSPNFSTCTSPGICEFVSLSPENSYFEGNAPGCSSIEEVQAQCESPCPDIDLNGVCDSVQTVYIGNLEFTSTSEVQTFANAFPQVHKIIGNLTLSGYTGDALFETEALFNLDTIQGLLSYSNYDQAGIAFSGFSNLRHVDTFIGAYPYYNYGITYNENDSTPIYSYCTNCFPSLISANKMQILTANEFSFNALERCDTLNINCSELNGAFSSLTQCKVLNINTNYFSSNQGSFFNPFDDNPYSLLNTILQQNEYACQSTIFSSFNQLDSINFFFATDAEISQSLNNIQHCKTIYVNNISTSESLMNLNSCENIYSNGNSSIMSCFDNITTLNTVGIYSSENTIDFPNLRELDFADFFLNDNSTLNLPLLDSIHTDAYIVAPYSFANNATINLSGLDYAQKLTFLFVQCNELQLPSSWSCGNLGIQNVQGLVSLNDLSIVEPGYINITECSDFSVCSSPGLCEHISQYPENCFFANNAPGCSSIEEIQTQCLGSYASGTVYYDLNCDQQFNNDDALVSYPILLQGDTLPIGSSGEAGYFFVPLELNNSTTLFAQHSADWSSEGPITLTTTDSLQVFTDIQIGLCPVTIIHDVAVSVNASMNPRPGFTVRYNLVAQNLWPGSDDVAIAFSTAQMPGAVITGYAAGGTLAGNQVSFATNLLYGQSQTLWVDVLVPAGTPLGTAYTATASIALSDAQAVDSHPENNNYSLAQTVIGSYDPNDKLVTPAVIDLLDIDSTQTATIEYTIRFQNTGTAEAFFVRVLDTLSQALNPATFELIATSHPSEITFHDNHTIEWFFDNIMLPDSFSNEPESHGFIQFRIQTLPLSEPFILENEAAIYFDFNEPVITPPAETSVVICAEAGEACDDGDSCTTNDMIQADCTCLGSSNDIDNDGICDLLDNCQGVPYLLTPITDLNLTCASSIPSDLPEFLMADNGNVTVSFTDSVITGFGCNALIQRTYIAENACSNRVYVAQLISTSDNIAPTMFNCPADTSLHCSKLTNFIAQPFATDNCDENVNITFTEECLNCTSDSTVLELFTPELPADNPCGYPYNWALALLNMSNTHRWYQIDTTINARMIDYHDGNARYVGRFVNVLNYNAGFDFDFTIGEGLNFEEWTNSHVSGFMADCGATADNHASWMYYILQSSPSAELIGWGDYIGSQLNITHAPANEYFGFQVGEGANNYNDSYGAGVFMSYSGIFSVNSEFVQTTGAGDFRFTIQDTTLTSVIRTWTATDCAGNSSSCAQVITCINDTIDPVCSPGQLCDDLDPCTINDLFQADCSCLGTFADNDNDGICDAEDGCDNTLAGTTCDDLDPCTTNDIIQSDCSCVGTFADADSDGICDTAEIAGCTDSDACNYNANATDDDGSCTYVESLSIEGNDNAVAGIEETYTYAGPASSAYQWSIDPGTIQSGQGTQTVSVIWNDALTGTLQVIETTATNCVGDTITLEVSVSPNAIDARNTQLFTIYPNPVSDILHIAGDIPSNARLSIYNGIGQCVYSGLLVSTIDVHTLAAGVYHLQLEHVGTVQRKKFTIVRGE